MNFGLEMKSLLVLLFLGAAVATPAEEPFEDEAVAELLDQEDDETIAELADEENDPRRRPRPSGPPRAVRSSASSPVLNRLLGFAQSASIPRPYNIGAQGNLGRIALPQPKSL